MGHATAYYAKRPPSGIAEPPTGNHLPLVAALSSQEVHDSYGICAHPAFQTKIYKHVDAWMAQLAALGVTYFRGAFDHANPGVRSAVAAARKYGVKWVMIVVPEDSNTPTKQTVASTKAKVQYIAQNCADVCMAIEGLNEPNHNRGGAPTTAGWEQVALSHQRTIWQTARAYQQLDGVPIIGPSLHDTEAARDGGAHYKLLERIGIGNFQNYMGMHRYPGGGVPTNGLDGRLQYIYGAFGPDYPVWITEWGYHNALNTRSGHKPASEEAAATYGPRGLLQFAQRGIPLVRYEVFDDPETALVAEESHFGIFGVKSVEGDPATTWRPKPEAAAMKSLLEGLDDPGADYTPEPVGLTVAGAADVRHLVTRKRNGEATVHLWREVSVWDPNGRKALQAPSTDVVVKDRIGARTIRVDAEVTSVRLR
jgi:hypothetical protein